MRAARYCGHLGERHYSGFTLAAYRDYPAVIRPIAVNTARAMRVSWAVTLLPAPPHQTYDLWTNLLIPNEAQCSAGAGAM